MGTKDVPPGEATAHYKRISAMKERFTSTSRDSMGLFGAVDIGEGSYWWDYGQLQLYAMNNLKLILADDNHEASTMRKFFNISANRIKQSEGCSIGESVAITEGSCVSHSSFKTGSVQGSVLAGVSAEHVECGRGSILVNVTARSIKVAPGCVVYNVSSDAPEGIVVPHSGQVLTRILLNKKDAAKHIKSPSKAVEAGSDSVIVEMMRSRIETDGGKVWKTRVEGNPFSFEEVYNANSAADVSVFTELSKTLHDEASASFGM